MSDELTFMMGEFAALFPTDRHYAKNHMWAQLVGDGPAVGDSGGEPTNGNRFRFGFAAYAVRLLQDVYFLDWHVEEGTTLSHGQEIGEIESSKAESSLYAPVAGRLVAINQPLLKDPSAINVDKYGTGWIFEIEVEGEGAGAGDSSKETRSVSEGHDQAGDDQGATGSSSASASEETSSASNHTAGQASSGTQLPPTILTPDQYIAHLEEVWAVTQRTIKGQLNA